VLPVYCLVLPVVMETVLPGVLTSELPLLDTSVELLLIVTYDTLAGMVVTPKNSELLTYDPGVVVVLT